MCIPSISPFEPFTYILAFCIIVGVSMVKDAMEDYKRHADDDIINKSVVKTVRLIENEDGVSEFEILEKYCMELEQGEFILICKDEQVQADVVLLRTKKIHKDKPVCANHCYIETSNLDGESNLKKRNALPSSKNHSYYEKAHDWNEGELICNCCAYFFKNIDSFDLKDTGDSFNEFECDFFVEKGLVLASNKHALLRGSILKNIEQALAIVVGVGSQTKQSKSLCKAKKTKKLFDGRMNFILVVVLLLYATLLLITGSVGFFFLISNQDRAYLGISSIRSSMIRLISSNYIIYTYLIPLSLYVILEIARFIQALYISHDINMVSGEKESVCRNSNAIEDLGMIDYILTDKTGTITKNSMTLKCVHERGKTGPTIPENLCSNLKSILATDSGSLDTDILKKVMYEDSPQRDLFLMVLNMLVCNSVEILNGKCEGISQEELCFLDAISRDGFFLTARDENFVIVEILGEKIKINIIQVLEFTSKRQKMGVIIELFGKYFLLNKGSDQVLLDKSKDHSILKIINSLTDYRCLVMKYKELDSKLVDKFGKLMKFEKKDENIADDENASETNLMDKKRRVVEEIFKTLEKDAIYLGSTFIEDELQDQVQETMRILKEAGIKIWMITGDKKETAIACGKNSCIIENDDFLAVDGRMALQFLERELEYEESDQRGVSRYFWRNSPNTSLNDYVSQDQNLSQNQSDDTSNPRIFDKPSIIVYRATPSQKGSIATLLVKSGKSALSIGDGNNDLAMLRNSHVGVGIMGKEGTQAALSADFAIPQFCNLKNLILIHGRYNFLRSTKIALNSYYKNIVFIFAQFLYNIFSGASGSPLYNSFTLNYYNLFFTSMIPFAVVLFDRDLSPSLALDQPASYKHVRNRFDNHFIFLNVFFALLEASVVFFGIRLLTLNDITNGTGMLGSYLSISTMATITIIFTVVLRQIRQVSYRVFFTDVAIVLTVILNIISVFAIQELYNRSNYAIYYLLSMPYFYFVCICLCTLIYSIDTIFENYCLYIEDKLKVKN